MLPLCEVHQWMFHRQWGGGLLPVTADICHSTLLIVDTNLALGLAASWFRQRQGGVLKEQTP